LFLSEITNKSSTLFELGTEQAEGNCLAAKARFDNG
jgi:hypothetical protein